MDEPPETLRVSVPDKFLVMSGGKIYKANAGDFENVHRGREGVVPVSLERWLSSPNAWNSMSAEAVVGKAPLPVSKVVVLRVLDDAQHIVRCHWFVRIAIMPPSIEHQERIGHSFLWELSPSMEVQFLNKLRLEAATDANHNHNNTLFFLHNGWLASGHRFDPLDWEFEEVTHFDRGPLGYSERIFAMSCTDSRDNGLLVMSNERIIEHDIDYCPMLLDSTCSGELQLAQPKRAKRTLSLQSTIDFMVAPDDIVDHVLGFVFLEMWKDPEQFAQMMNLRLVSRAFDRAFRKSGACLHESLIKLIQKAHASRSVADAQIVRWACAECKIPAIYLHAEGDIPNAFSLLNVRAKKVPGQNPGTRIKWHT